MLTYRIQIQGTQSSSSLSSASISSLLTPSLSPPINSGKCDRKLYLLIQSRTSCYSMYSKTQWNLHTVHQIIYLLLIHDLGFSILDAHVLQTKNKNNTAVTMDCFFFKVHFLQHFLSFGILGSLRGFIYLSSRTSEASMVRSSSSSLSSIGDWSSL